MKAIQMVDLQSQYLDIKQQIDASMQEVINHAAFINGPQVQDFKKSLAHYLGVKHVVTCGNGTDALQIALMALGLQKNDEVITVDFTFAATVEVIKLLDVKPVLVDVDVQTFNIDITALKKAITPKTKAIIPVHLFGQCANMEAVLQVAKQHQLYVIEDAAQALGADYFYKNGVTKKAGTLGTIGTTSFFPSKNLGCYGDGGALFTDDDDLAVKLTQIANHGMSKKYHHDRIGINSRLDSLQAAVLNTKLPFLEAYNKARINSAHFYNKAFADHVAIKTPTIASFTSHVFHQYTLRVLNGKRDELHHFLLKNKIPNAIYYPIPLHQQKAYLDSRYSDDCFKNTHLLTEQVISLPMHTALTQEQLVYITQAVLHFFNT